MSFTIIEPATARLNRSELAVPGSSPALFEKAAASAADVVFLDLEDAVAPDDNSAKLRKAELLIDIGYRDQADELAALLRERFDASVMVEEGKFGQFDVLLGGELIASKGGFWKRKLIHGAPPQAQVLETIERSLADRSPRPPVRES